MQFAVHICNNGSFKSQPHAMITKHDTQLNTSSSKVSENMQRTSTWQTPTEVLVSLQLILRWERREMLLNNFIALCGVQLLHVGKDISWAELNCLHNRGSLACIFVSCDLKRVGLNESGNVEQQCPIARHWVRVRLLICLSRQNLAFTSNRMRFRVRHCVVAAWNWTRTCRISSGCTNHSPSEASSQVVLEY